MDRKLHGTLADPRKSIQSQITVAFRKETRISGKETEYDVKRADAITENAIKLATQDFAPIALEIRNKAPDAIVYFMLQQDMTILTKELQRQGIRPRNDTYSPNVLQSLIDLGGESVEAMRGVSLTVPPSTTSPAITEYRDALAKFGSGEKPDFSSLTTFGQAKLFGEALERVKGPLNRWHDHPFRRGLGCRDARGRACQLSWPRGLRPFYFDLVII